MSLNPFEVRLQILEMSKDYLDGLYQSQLEATKTMMSAYEETGKLTKEVVESMMPIKYSMKDVVDKATELYEFVVNDPIKGKKQS